MDLNVLMISGRLAVAPEVCEHPSGSRSARLLVATRRDAPVRRVDVLPVRCWDPTAELLDAVQGHRVWVRGSLQRRFSESAGGRRSRLEVVADRVSLTPCDPRAGSLPRP
jgi:single-stranded DNA-binding protein